MRIILHEGKDDKKYIKRICNYLKIQVTDENFYEMRDKSTFFKEENEIYQLIKANSRISKMLFVLDADYKTNDSVYGGCDNAQREILKMIEKLGLSDRSDYYITCDPTTKNGYFETLFSLVFQMI